MYCRWNRSIHLWAHREELTRSKRKNHSVSLAKTTEVSHVFFFKCCPEDMLSEHWSPRWSTIFVRFSSHPVLWLRSTYLVLVDFVSRCSRYAWYHHVLSIETEMIDVDCTWRHAKQLLWHFPSALQRTSMPSAGQLEQPFAHEIEFEHHSSLCTDFRETSTF